MINKKQICRMEGIYLVIDDVLNNRKAFYISQKKVFLFNLC